MKRLLAALALMLAAGPVQARPLRAMSLDQCADQYLLALAPEADLYLSPRADDPDSWLRDQARGRTRVRPTLEQAVARDPDVVVRYWGGDARLMRRLERDGRRVVNLDDATDFAGVRVNIRRVAAAFDRPQRGEALIAAMDQRLAQAARKGPRDGRTALYLTPGGFTSGPGSLVDAVLRAAGYRNAARAPGFAPVRVEAIALSPPARFVLGFFDQFRSDWRGPGRHPVVRKAMERRVVGSLPGAAMGCPAWFAADAALALARTP